MQNTRWPLENAPIGPVPGLLGLEDGKNVEKSTHIWLGEKVVVITAKVASLDRFQAQPIWEIPVGYSRGGTSLVLCQD